MAEVTIADVTSYNRLAGLEDNEIEAHLQSAVRELSSVTFASPADYTEAVSCKTIINVAPILLARGMNNFPNYETIYTNAGDIEKFVKFYENRLSDILDRAQTTISGDSGIKYGAV